MPYPDKSHKPYAGEIYNYSFVTRCSKQIYKSENAGYETL